MNFASQFYNFYYQNILGYFKLGSTVILLFANQQNINWLSNIKEL